MYSIKKNFFAAGQKVYQASHEGMGYFNDPL